MASLSTRRLERASRCMGEHLHFVRSLAEYTMHRIVGTLWARLERQVHRATNIDDIRRAKGSYIAQVRLECLLDKTSPAPKAVEDLIECCERFAQRLREYASLRDDALPYDESARVAGISWDELRRTRKRFQNGNRFLVRILTERVRRGGVPHLEELLERLDGGGYFQEGNFKRNIL